MTNGNNRRWRVGSSKAVRQNIQESEWKFGVSFSLGLPDLDENLLSHRAFILPWWAFASILLYFSQTEVLLAFIFQRSFGIRL
jgi:hypothetical protein